MLFIITSAVDIYLLPRCINSENIWLPASLPLWLSHWLTDQNSDITPRDKFTIHAASILNTTYLSASLTLWLTNQNSHIPTRFVLSVWSKFTWSRPPNCSQSSLHFIFQLDSNYPHFHFTHSCHLVLVLLLTTCLSDPPTIGKFAPISSQNMRFAAKWRKFQILCWMIVSCVLTHPLRFTLYSGSLAVSYCQCRHRQDESETSTHTYCHQLLTAYQLGRKKYEYWE